MKANPKVGRRVLLLAGASALASMPASAWAQEDPAAESGQDTDQPIVVTGSRLRGTAPVGSSLLTLGRDTIETSPAVTTDRLIKEIPQNFDLGVSENSRAQSGGSGNIVYGNTVNLRGIGPYATLVMIDGHRVVNNSRSTDPSVIPTLGLERVEVVADGASAVYGSDAIAGVVNLVPRRSLDGVEAFVRGGIADRDGFDELALGAAVGKVFDRGQVMLAYEHVERSNLSGDDRDFFVSDQRSFGGNDFRPTRCSPGTIRNGTGATAVSYAIPAGGVTQATAATLVAGTVNRCNDLTGQDLFPEQTYDSVNGTATFELTDWLTFFADGFYSRREFYRRGAFPSTALAVPSSNAFFVLPPGLTLAQLGACPASAGVPAGTRCLTVDHSFRDDVPPGDTSGFAESWQITPGLRFSLPYDWELEALVVYGETHDFSGAYTGINNAALAAALRSTNPATAFDPFGLHRTSQAVLANIADQIFLAPTDGTLTAYEARANGGLVDLPGGEVKLAVGFERQEFEVDLGSARGGPTTPITFRSFGRTVDSVYAELLVPLFDSTNAIPGFHELEINAAIRHDDYSDVGNTTNPKFGINWSPVDGLRLRGSYGTSFRAPTIPEIYGNSNNLFVQNYNNPAGGASIQGVALSGQNLDLDPETATTWSIGVDFDAVENLRLGVTYWDVDYENQVIANLSNLAILNQEALYAGTGIILRGAEAQARVAELVASGVTFVGSPAQPIQLFVDGRSQNLGVSKTSGIDFTADYEWPVGAEHLLLFNVGGTYITNYEVAVTPTAPLVDQLNLIFRPLEFKARASVGWVHRGWNARLLATHVGGYTNDTITGGQSVSSFTPLDLFVSYTFGQDGSWTPFGKAITLGAEVRNLLDDDPPYVNIAPSGNGSGGYDATAASPIGRVFAASLRMKI
jgi:iron complex outermembrane receptor protein